MPDHARVYCAGRTQPRAAYPRRCSSNASGLHGRNSVRILGIRASFQRDNLRRHFAKHRQGCRQGNLASGRRERCLPTPLVQIQILSPVNHCARRSRLSRSVLMVGRPRCDRYDDHRQRKNHREPKCEAIWFRCHLFPSWQPTEARWRGLEAESGEMCELLHTLLPGINVTMLFRLARGGTG
jgi:hypothetical protein